MPLSRMCSKYGFEIKFHVIVNYWLLFTKKLTVYKNDKLKLLLKTLRDADIQFASKDKYLEVIFN